MPRGVGGGDDLVVADRAARLDHGRHAGRGERLEAVGEREEGVAGARRRPWRGPAALRRDLGRLHRGTAGPRRCRRPAPSLTSTMAFDLRPRTTATPARCRATALGRRPPWSRPATSTRLGDEAVGVLDQEARPRSAQIEPRGSAGAAPRAAGCLALCTRASSGAVVEHGAITTSAWGPRRSTRPAPASTARRRDDPAEGATGVDVERALGRPRRGRRPPRPRTGWRA